MIENNSETKLALQRIQFEAPDDWRDNKILLESTEYAMELDKRNPVLEGISNKLGIEKSDIESIRKELNIRYKRMGIEEGVPKSVKNWLIGIPASTANKYRENLYNLCLALELSANDTVEFFLKNFMTIPFNYKDRTDAIYYYGFTHNLDYKKIKIILDEFKNSDSTNEKYNDRTAAIGECIAEIDDLDNFKEYLRLHTYCEKAQYNTAFEEIKQLQSEDAKLAEIECLIKKELIKKSNEDDDKKSGHKIYKNGDNGSINISGLLWIIYEYDSQANYLNHELQISKCESLPRLFKNNFPNDEEFIRIDNKSASPDVYRKAIIILKFYNYYCHNLVMSIYGTDEVTEETKTISNLDNYRKRDEINDEDIDVINEDLEEFYYETSDLLAKCGFVQMYIRNPFDWLILYCAKSTDPLETFRALLAERYWDRDQI